MGVLGATSWLFCVYLRRGTGIARRPDYEDSSVEQEAGRAAAETKGLCARTDGHRRIEAVS
jgi:hypothetical protein